MARKAPKGAKKAKEKPRKSSAQKSGKGSSLGLTLFLVVTVIVVAMAASALFTSFYSAGQVGDRVARELQRGLSAFSVLRLGQQRELELAARAIAADTTLIAELAALAAPPSRRRGEDEEPTLPVRLENHRDSFDLELVALLDAEGKVAAAAGTLLAPGQDLAAEPLFTAARGQQNRDWAAGLKYDAAGFHHVLVRQLVRDFELVGHLVVAYEIGDGFATDLERAVDASIVFFAQTPNGPAVEAAALARGDAATVIDALRREGQALARVSRGETVPQTELEIGGEPWMAFVAPLRDAADQTLGAMVALDSLTERQATFKLQRYLVLGIALLALALAFPLVMGLARRARGPVAQLAGAVESLRDGGYDAEWPKARGPLAPVIEPLEELTRKLREKQVLESFVLESTRALPEPARGTGGAAPPLTRQSVLVAVEMRRFANPKIGYDPEENIQRYDHDLRRLNDSVKRHEGQIESLSGHRILAVFEGENHAFRALAAATEMLLLLSHRENAFDEPVPPVVVMAMGPVVSGGVKWSGKSATAVAGLPVQQLESLLREAAPGDLYLAKAVAATLVKALKQAGVELRGQRSLVGSQPLYVLDAAGAQRFTGVELPTESRTVTKKRTLADVAPGEVLGGRFEVQAELGAGPSGVDFKCADRERGDLLWLRVLRPEILADPTRLEHLRQVTGQVRGLVHPNVLTVHDFGEADGLAYIAMDFIRGASLREILTHRRQIPLLAAFLLARQIAEGLRVAHAKQLAHGGLRPEEILIDNAGTVRLSGFGLGSPIHPAQRDQTIEGVEYLAPEQLEGEPAAPSADLYSWGAVFYEMLAGQVPVVGTTATEIATLRMEADPDRPSLHCPDLPPPLDDLIVRCLEISPGMRPASLEDLVRELDALK